MVHIEEYKEQYQDQVLRLILNIQNNEYDIAITAEQQPDLADIKGNYQQGVGNFWIARIGQEVIGSISLLDISNGQAALRKMFVQKEYRGKTYNTAALLLNTALEWSQSHGIGEIYLGTTAQFHAAHAFYEKHNFRQISRTHLPARFPVMEVDTRFYTYSL